MSRNVEMILNTNSASKNEENDDSNDISKPVDTGNYQKLRNVNSELSMPVFHECSSKSDELSDYRSSDLSSRPSSTNNRTDHMTTNISDESTHFPVLRRPDSAPSFCSTSSSFANDRGIFSAMNKPTSLFNDKTDLTAFKSISCPARYGLTEICDDGILSENQPTVFNNNGNCTNDSSKFSDQGIPSRFHFSTDGGAAAHDDADFETPLLQGAHERECSTSDLPVISISDYDFMMRESIKRSSPTRHSTDRESESYLQLPRKRQLGGSESGYSTSPSPDISCV